MRSFLETRAFIHGCLKAFGRSWLPLVAVAFLASSCNGNSASPITPGSATGVGFSERTEPEKSKKFSTLGNNRSYVAVLLSAGGFEASDEACRFRSIVKGLTNVVLSTDSFQSLSLKITYKRPSGEQIEQRLPIVSSRSFDNGSNCETHQIGASRAVISDILVSDVRTMDIRFELKYGNTVTSDIFGRIFRIADYFTGARFNGIKPFTQAKKKNLIEESNNFDNAVKDVLSTKSQNLRDAQFDYWNLVKNDNTKSVTLAFKGKDGNVLSQARVTLRFASTAIAGGEESDESPFVPRFASASDSYLVHDPGKQFMDSSKSPNAEILRTYNKLDPPKSDLANACSKIWQKIIADSYHSTRLFS